MLRQRKINTTKTQTAKSVKLGTRYSLLMVLIMQLAITSILCATSSYIANANAITICTAFGLKTISLDENGEPVEQEQHEAFSKTCFHCASSCSMAALAPQSEEVIYIGLNQIYRPTVVEVLKTKLLAQGPPPRAPPVHA
jgi:hypothetical protein